MDNDFLKWVQDNDGRAFKQGSRQEDVLPIVERSDIIKVFQTFNDLTYDVKKLAKQVENLIERVEHLEAKDNGWHTDEWGSYKL